MADLTQDGIVRLPLAIGQELLWACFRVLPLSPLSVNSMQPYSDPSFFFRLLNVILKKTF